LVGTAGQSAKEQLQGRPPAQEEPAKEERAQVEREEQEEPRAEAVAEAARPR
jgi:hypothetical protein